MVGNLILSPYNIGTHFMAYIPIHRVVELVIHCCMVNGENVDGEYFDVKRH